MEVNRFHIYTSSAKKQQGTIEDYSFTLRRPMLLTNPHHYFKLIVKECTIPYTFQQVSNHFNSFKYSITRGATTYTDRIFTIPNGNYTILSLITALITAWNTDINSIFPGYVPGFLFTYDRNTMFVSFTFTTDATNTSFTIQPLQDQISTMLGVVNNTTFNNVGSAITIGISTQPVNVNPITSIYVRSASLKQNYRSTENIVDSDDISDILCQIPILNQPTSWIQYLNDLQIENQLINDTINTINLYLTDNRSYSLDLRGIDWSCLITILEIAPHEEQYITDMRNDIKNGNNAVMDTMIESATFQKGFPVVKQISGDSIPNTLNWVKEHPIAP